MYSCSGAAIARCPLGCRTLGGSGRSHLEDLLEDVWTQWHGVYLKDQLLSLPTIAQLEW